MKIKTRLILYDFILISLSVILIVLIVIFTNARATELLQPLNTPNLNQNFAQDFNPSDYSSKLSQFFSDFIIIILLSLAILISVAIFLSNHLLKFVTTPVNLLASGATRVKNGDYKTPINYASDDEFKPLIDNFNHMQAALAENAEKAATYEVAKRTMISGISHDLRTPLTVVKGNLKGILDGVANTPEKREQYLSAAYIRTLDIENLMQRLFETFDFETAEIKLEKTHTDFTSFLKNEIAKNELIAAKKLAVSCDFPEKPLFLDLDQTEFHRVLDNLFNNTVKHNPDAKNLQVSLSLTSTKNSTRFIFSDNGSGVKPESLPCLFDEFFKEDSSRSSDKKSSGLGLFIVKKIITSHGGSIYAENIKPHGLRFIITLPLAENPENSEKSVKSAIKTTKKEKKDA